MRILGLHTIALMFGVLIAACTNITQVAQNPSGPQLAEPTLEARSNSNPRLATHVFKKANHSSLEANNLDALRLKKP
jgi:hypothetical protein